MGVRDCVAHLAKGAGVTSPWNKLYGGVGVTPLRGSAEVDFNLWSLWEAFVGKGRRCPYCSHTGGRHAIGASQPHIYVEGSDGNLTKRVLGHFREVTLVLCAACAREHDTDQAVCYMEKRQRGDILLADGRLFLFSGAVEQWAPPAEQEAA